MNLNNKYDILVGGLEVKNIELKDLLNKSDKTLLYFYPRDNTPGCTTENKDFSFLKQQFLELGIQIVGVSKDSIDFHKRFVEKQDLLVDLLSDPELILHKELLVYGEKNNYGKIVMGIIRSTFLVNKKGKLLGEWRNVRAKGHAERILKELS